jgi:pyruvate/2-oxoglutarate/acetoin dehydrogenase E1 component
MPTDLTYRQALLEAMDNALGQYPNTVIMGQGVDDHKGIFGTTLGLAEKYGADRVMDVPLAEEGMMGVAIGLALNGMYPIVTHIRTDFTMLAMNQIVNLLSKYRYMFGGRFKVPMLIRMVIGRGWGQGAQHSQSLHPMFCHIPGLTVLMPASASIVAEEYPAIIGECLYPVISIEHRLLYDLVDTRTHRQGYDLTIVATSLMTVEAIRAAAYVEHYGVECAVIDVRYPSHINIYPILCSLELTGKLLVLDTGWTQYGVGAEICKQVLERRHGLLNAPAVILGTEPCPCPTAKKLEDLFYPSQRRIVAAIQKMVGKEFPLPEETSTVQDYRTFRGPF